MENNKSREFPPPPPPPPRPSSGVATAAGEFTIPMPPSNNHHSPSGTPTYPRYAASPSPDIPKSTPGSPINKPPLSPSSGGPGPGLTRRKTFNRPKSRFGEPTLPIDLDTIGAYGSPRSNFNSPASVCSSPGAGATRAVAQNQKTPRAGAVEKQDDPDEREIYSKITAQLGSRNQNRLTLKVMIEIFFFLSILCCLIASFTYDKMKSAIFCGLKVWKWFVLVMVIFSGMLITQWLVHLVVFFIEWKYILKKNVVYFTHGLRNSVEVFIWIGVILLTWVLLFKPDVDQSHRTRKFLDYVTWTITSLLIGSFLWLLKNTMLKVLASSFHLNRFFDRIQESVFHHYVLQTLSGRPMMMMARRICRSEDTTTTTTNNNNNNCGAPGQVSFTENINVKNKEVKRVDMAKLHRMKKDRVPSYTMQLLVDVVSNSGLSTLSGMMIEDYVEGGVELDDDEITSEEHAIATAVRIFENIVRYSDDTDHQLNFIDKDDLLNFMIEEEVDLFYPLIEIDDNCQITLKAFSAWVVKVFKDRLQLQHALNDNKTAVNQLNKVVTFILLVIVFILWLLLTEIATTKLLLFFSSQLLVAGFIFGNTCKTIFEAIIFVFVMHPFDVGDRCLVDGTMLLVEEMNILTTVFLKVDKEKVYYPNAILATKPISNYYRSPENQGDWIEFSIDFRTPVSKIGELKERIKKYLVANPHHWRPEHYMFVREIENVNKIKMALFASHTINFQDFAEKNRRKSDLILEFKKVFEELEIKYQLLPQEVLLTNFSMATTNSSNFIN